MPEGRTARRRPTLGTARIRQAYGEKRLASSGGNLGLGRGSRGNGQ
jgi:hypothetical protein